MSSRQFRKEEAPFVEKFVTDLSKRWDTADVNDRMTIVKKDGAVHVIGFFLKATHVGGASKIQV